MPRLGRDDRIEWAQSESYRRQYERNYAAHIRGTPEWDKARLAQRRRGRRYGRYFLSALAWSGFGIVLVVGFVAGPTIYDQASEAVDAWLNALPKASRKAPRRA